MTNLLISKKGSFESLESINELVSEEETEQNEKSQSNISQIKYREKNRTESSSSLQPTTGSTKLTNSELNLKENNTANKSLNYRHSVADIHINMSSNSKNAATLQNLDLRHMPTFSKPPSNDERDFDNELQTPKQLVRSECKYISSVHKEGWFSRTKWNSGVAILDNTTLTLHKITNSKVLPLSIENKPNVTIPLRTYTASFSRSDPSDNKAVILNLSSDCTKMSHKLSFENSTVALDWCWHLKRACEEVFDIPPSIPSIASNSSLMSDISGKSGGERSALGIYDRDQQYKLKVNGSESVDQNSAHQSLKTIMCKFPDETCYSERKYDFKNNIMQFYGLHEKQIHMIDRDINLSNASIRITDGPIQLTLTKRVKRQPIMIIDGNYQPLISLAVKESKIGFWAHEIKSKSKIKLQIGGAVNSSGGRRRAQTLPVNSEPTLQYRTGSAVFFTYDDREPNDQLASLQYKYGKMGINHHKPVKKSRRRHRSSMSSTSTYVDVDKLENLAMPLNQASGHVSNLSPEILQKQISRDREKERNNTLTSLNSANTTSHKVNLGQYIGEVVSIEDLRVIGDSDDLDEVYEDHDTLRTLVGEENDIPIPIKINRRNRHRPTDPEAHFNSVTSTTVPIPLPRTATPGTITPSSPIQEEPPRQFLSDGQSSKSKSLTASSVPSARSSVHSSISIQGQEGVRAHENLSQNLINYLPYQNFLTDLANNVSEQVTKNLSNKAINLVGTGSNNTTKIQTMNSSTQVNFNNEFQDSDPQYEESGSYSSPKASNSSSSISISNTNLANIINHSDMLNTERLLQDISEKTKNMSFVPTFARRVSLQPEITKSLGMHKNNSIGSHSASSESVSNSNLQNIRSQSLDPTSTDLQTVIKHVQSIHNDESKSYRDKIRLLNQSRKTEFDMLLMIKKKQREISWKLPIQLNEGTDYSQRGNMQLSIRLEAEEAIIRARIEMIEGQMRQLERYV